MYSIQIVSKYNRKQSEESIAYIQHVCTCLYVVKINRSTALSNNVRSTKYWLNFFLSTNYYSKQYI